MEQKLLTRVRGLLDKAAATTFPDEADALTAKAAELIAKYGIDEAMLAAAGGRNDPIDQTRIDMTDPYSNEKALLLASVGHAMRCTVMPWGTARRTTYCMLIGYGVDRERTELLYTSLLVQAVTQALSALPTYHNNTTSYRRSWLYGFAVTIHERLEEIERHAQDQAEHSGTPGTALVLADRRTQVERYTKSIYPDLPEGESKFTLDPHGFLGGQEAGYSADLGQTQVENHHAKALT
jgi:hypothetical protein